MSRTFMVFLHRWIGLVMAGFLIVVGLTGSLLAFLPELDRLVTPQLFPGEHGPPLYAATLVRRAEALAPGARAKTIYFNPSGSAQVGMEPLPGGEELYYSQIYLDATTGMELGRVRLGGLPHKAGEIMPFIYNLHYSLILGDVGEWILGLIALAWTIDCFVAFYLTLPAPFGATRKSFLSRWKPAWLVKWRSSFYRINFDLHRASGLWLWAILLIFAWSSVFMDLNGFYAAITRTFADYEQPVWAKANPQQVDNRPPMSWEEAEAVGRRLMDDQARLGDFKIDRLNAFYLMREKGLFEYRVHSTRDIGDKYGSTTIYFDSHSGALVETSIPTGQRAGNTLTTWLIELHMANLWGMPYKIFVCALGLIVATLSITGVYIWWKKRAARRLRQRGDVEAKVLPENVI